MYADHAAERHDQAQALRQGLARLATYLGALVEVEDLDQEAWGRYRHALDLVGLELDARPPLDRDQDQPPHLVLVWHLARLLGHERAGAEELARQVQALRRLLLVLLEERADLAHHLRRLLDGEQALDEVEL